MFILIEEDSKKWLGFCLSGHKNCLRFNGVGLKASWLKNSVIIVPEARQLFEYCHL